MIAVTGATGHLGRLAVESLLERGVPAADIVAVVRTPARAAALAERGVMVRQGDYDEPDTLRAALAGVERLLLVSGDEVGKRIEQHGNVITAASEAEVGLIAYTSVIHADRTRIQLAAEHQATEQMLSDSKLPYVLLRNSWYLELYLGQIPRHLAHGVILGCSGEGRVSAATRADYAAAAATVIAEPGHENHIYELGGEPAFSMNELAAEVSRQSGTKVEYRDLPLEEYVQVLVGAGLPEGYARVLADADVGLGRGELFTDSGDLRRLLGRAPTPYTEAVAAGLARSKA